MFKNILKSFLFTSLFLVYATALLARPENNGFVLGEIRDLNLIEGRFYDNGGKDSAIINEYFISTIHGGTTELEMYFDQYDIPEGALLKIYEGKNNEGRLMGVFGKRDKIWNMYGFDITIEYIPAARISGISKGFSGIVRPRANHNSKKGGRASNPESDCTGALPICNNLTAVALGGKYTDLGSVSDDGGSCYGGTGSGGAVWYSFQPQADGPLDFGITPSGNTDYDFVLWDITSGCGTNQRKELSCNYSVLTGSTGVSSTLCSQPGGSCSSNDCTTDSKGSDCNRYNRRPSVLASHKYAVCINFYSGSNDGFTISFKNEASSVTITDIIPPVIANATANACPGASSFVLRFSEYIDCSTLQTIDLTMPGHTVTLGATNCSNNATNNITINVTPPLTSGSYTIHGQDILDLCGNNMNSDFSIVIGASPTPTINADKTTCKSLGFLGIGYTYTPASQTLTAGGGSYYQWSDGQVGSSISVSPTTTTTYTVTVTQGACPATATTTVNVESTVAPTVPDQFICVGNSAILTATGGGTYQWYKGPTILGNGTAVPGGNTASITVSPTATTKYRVVVTSPGGCKAQTDVTVNIVTSNCCNAAISPAGPYCNTDAPKTLTAGTSGGTWSGTGITNAATGEFSPAVAGTGTYKVYYELSCGAKDSATIVVQACTSLSVCKETNGNVTVSGGIGPYAWQRQTTSQDCSGCPGGNCIPFLCPGTSVTNWTTFATTATTAPGALPIQVKDNSGAIVSVTVLSSLPACSSCPPFTITPAANTPAKCNGQANGSFSVTTTGGTSPYSYVLKNGATTVATFNGITGSQAFTALAAGTYTLNVTDNNACTGTTTITITQPAALAATVPTTTPATCGNANGGATAAATGGTGAYTYSWSNSASGPSISNVIANTYTVTVTDANLCTATASATIANGAAIIATIAPSAASCGNADGSAKVTITAGTGPYTYLWSDNQTTDPATALAAGNYQVTITGAGGCTATASTTISSSSAIAATVAPTGTTCGNADGSAIVTITAGTGPYSYLWSNNQTTNPATALSAGNYQVTITGAGGCTATASTTISSSSAIVATVAPTGTTCGNADGSAIVTITAGTGPYSYLWSNNQTTNPATALAAGNYQVTITGAGGCTAIASGTIASSSPVNATITPVHTSCGNNNGGAKVNVSAGVAPYNYIWNNGQFTDSAISLAPGNYQVTITDAANCTIVSVTSINTSSGLVLGINTTDANCGSLDGEAAVQVTSGTGPFTYKWDNGQLNSTATGLGAGVYTVTVTGAGGCTASANANISNINGPVINLIDTNAETCFGKHDGDVTITASGGTGTLNIVWGDGNAAFSRTALAPGNYSFSVTDASGCTATGTAAITAGGLCCPLQTTAAATAPGCGLSDGTITVNILIVGSAPYQYKLDNGALQSNNVFNNLAGGSYSAVTFDAGGCSDTVQVIVPNAPASFTTQVAAVPPTCGGNDGSATVTTIGTTGVVSYSWDNGQSAQTAVNLSAGTYMVTVSDASSGCSVVETVVVPAGAGCCNLQIADNTTPPSCGAADGVITINIITAGTAPYTYSANGGAAQAGNTFSNLSGGNYQIIVVDAAGCRDTVDVVVPAAPAGFSSVVSSNSISCFGVTDGSASVAVTGNTGALTYAWSNSGGGAAIGNLAAGVYYITVSEAGSLCTAIDSAIITEPAQLLVSISGHLSACEGDSVELTADAGFSSYGWNNGSTLQNLFADTSGTYTVFVADANGCTATSSVLVNIHAAPVISLGKDTTAFENDQIVLNANVSGTPNANGYHWSPATNLSCTSCETPVATVKDSIDYVLHYTDANGCESYDTLSIYIDKAFDIEFPNVFSPNGDNANDFFRPEGGPLKNLSWQVFNRWGELVYSTNETGLGWDGKYMGIDQPTGVYVYFASYTRKDGKVRILKGSLNLIR
jgi:gliding motility-associated-like protein